MTKSEIKLYKKTVYYWFGAFKSHALKQNIEVEIKPNTYEKNELIIDSKVKDELDKLFLRILDFTPLNCKIVLSIESIERHKIYLNALVEGINLFRISEILLVTELIVKRLDVEGNNTQYQIVVPKKANTCWEKPLNFSPYYLEINKNLRNHFIGVNPEDKVLKSNQEHDTFLKLINKLLELHLQDEGFGVTELSAALHISRTHLYRKVKKITNISPLSYIKLFRLELAKQIIIKNNKDLTITEVGYSCGFLDKSHFSRSFKEHFGMSPSTFKKQMHVT